MDALNFLSDDSDFEDADPTDATDWLFGGLPDYERNTRRTGFPALFWDPETGPFGRFFRDLETPPSLQDYENERNSSASMRNSETLDNASHLTILRLQLDDLRHSLEHDRPDNDSRAAIQCQIHEPELLIEEGDDVGEVAEVIGQPNLGPPEVTEPRPALFPDPDRPEVTHVDEIQECTICFDQLTRQSTVVMPCSHKYCRQCFITLLEEALRDESLFPPRCCERVPNDLISMVMGRDFYTRYLAKSIEFETLIPRRVYCCNSECARFLGPKPPIASISRRVCKHCGVGTCTRCTRLAQAAGEDYHTRCVAGEADETFPRGGARGGLPALLPLPSLGGAQLWLQPYDMSLWF